MHAINRTNKFVGSIRIPFPVPIVITAVTAAQPLPPPLHADVQSTPNWFYFHSTWTRQSATVCNDSIIIIVDCIEPWSLLLAGNSRLCATPSQNVHVCFRVHACAWAGEGDGGDTKKFCAIQTGFSDGYFALLKITCGITWTPAKMVRIKQSICVN